MKYKPHISVILPVYNGETWLANCIDSILNQTFTDFEVIISDNQSTDSTQLISNQYLAKDSRIRYHRTSNPGIVAALNEAIQISRGKFLARMDCDDVMTPNRLELQSKALDMRHHISLVTGKIELVSEQICSDGFQEYVNFLNELNTPYDFSISRFIESPVAHPSVMIRKSALPDGLYRHGFFPEDYDLWLRMLRNGAQFMSIPETVLKWRDHNKRTSRNDDRYSIENIYQHKLMFLADWLLSKNIDKVALWTGKRKAKTRYKHILNNGVRISYLIDVNPQRINTISENLPIISPDQLLQGERVFIVIMVGNRGARSEIKSWLKKNGYIEETDFIIAA